MKLKSWHHASEDWKRKNHLGDFKQLPPVRAPLYPDEVKKNEKKGKKKINFITFFFELDLTFEVD